MNRARLQALPIRALCVALALGMPPASSVRAQADDLDTRIARAVERGRDHLLPHVARLAANPPSGEGLGRLAITTAAALKSGAAWNDVSILQAFARMRRMELQATYGVSCYLFALDAWVKAHEREDASPRDGAAREMRDEMRDEIRRASVWLIEARAPGRGYWTYGSHSGARRGDAHDFSNSQFAILGLEIALTQGLTVPKAVFREIAGTFLRSRIATGARQRLTLRNAASLETLLTRPPSRTGVASELGGETRVYNTTSSGWGYRANDGTPRASMTAAGASSLVIARLALEGSDARLVAEIDRAIVEAFAHVDRNFDAFLNGGLYTLYSLEKFGDLAEIDRIGEHDWYREGAEKILAQQRDNGSWNDRYEVYVDTSLALLFLTRAARLKPMTAPRIVTGAGRGASDDVKSDLVYIRRVDGFLSAHEVLRVARTTRDRRLREVVEEAIDHFPLERRAELVPDLLRLWNGRSDSLGKLALLRAREITGLESGNADDFARYLDDLARVEAAEKAAARRGPVELESLRALFASTSAPRLRDRLVDIVHRRRLHALLSTLVDELATADELHDRKVTGVLELWTALRAAPPPAGSPRRGPSAQRHVASWWRDWLAREGDRFLASRELDGLIDQLDSASPELVRAAIEAIVRIGEPAVPALRNALSTPICSFHVVEALERLTDTEIGLAR